jgi:hypothetical protein
MMDCEKPGDCAYPGCDCPEDDDPFEEDDAYLLDCEHEEYDLDILTGRATCIRCDHRWFMSEDELRRDGILRQTPYPGEEE